MLDDKLKKLDEWLKRLLILKDITDHLTHIIEKTPVVTCKRYNKLIVAWEAKKFAYECGIGAWLYEN